METQKRILGLVMTWYFVALLALAAIASAQAPTTETWTISASSGCTQTVKSPYYFCHASMKDTNGNVESLTFYIHDAGSGFTNGQISSSDLYGTAPTFNSNNWAGSNFSGSFSGTNPNGQFYSGNAQITMGYVKICRICGYGFGPVSGTVSLTFQ
jgi:hypothetical protein